MAFLIAAWRRRIRMSVCTYIHAYIREPERIETYVDEAVDRGRDIFVDRLSVARYVARERRRLADRDDPLDVQGVLLPTRLRDGLVVRDEGLFPGPRRGRGVGEDARDDRVVPLRTLLLQNDGGLHAGLGDFPVVRQELDEVIAQLEADVGVEDELRLLHVELVCDVDEQRDAGQHLSTIVAVEVSPLERVEGEEPQTLVLCDRRLREGRGRDTGGAVNPARGELVDLGRPGDVRDEGGRDFGHRVGVCPRPTLGSEHTDPLLRRSPEGAHLVVDDVLSSESPAVKVEVVEPDLLECGLLRNQSVDLQQLDAMVEYPLPELQVCECGC